MMQAKLWETPGFRQQHRGSCQKNSSRDDSRKINYLGNLKTYRVARTAALLWWYSWELLSSALVLLRFRDSHKDAPIRLQLPRIIFDIGLKFKVNGFELILENAVLLAIIH